MSYDDWWKKLTSATFLKRASSISHALKSLGEYPIIGSFIADGQSSPGKHYPSGARSYWARYQIRRRFIHCSLKHFVVNKTTKSPVFFKEQLLRQTVSSSLVQTLFGFWALEGGSWDLEMELPRASMMPDPEAVATLTSQQRQVWDTFFSPSSNAKYENAMECVRQNKKNVKPISAS